MFTRFYVQLRRSAIRAAKRPSKRTLVGLLLGLLALLPALIAPGSAAARPGPRSFATGFDEDATFQNPIDSYRTLWFNHARSAGSTWVRLGVDWREIAPSRRPQGFIATDPAARGYNWYDLDAGVRTAAATGQQVLLMITYAPGWALGPHAPRHTPGGTWEPNPRDLGQFATAVARRYSGRFPDPLIPGASLSRVTHFQAWNEPNINVSLNPQWKRGARGRAVPASPSLYRRMLNAVYRAVKAVDHHAVVLAAGLAPYGDPPGGARISPVRFMRQVLCLSGTHLRAVRCPDPAHFDAIDHHPYSLTPTVHAFNADDVSVPDLGRLTRLVRVARRKHRVIPAGPKGTWVTEIDWGSNPPDRHAISLATQATYLARAFYQLWRQGVTHVFWFELHDPGFREDGLTGAGVFFNRGRPKPSATAFRFPFVALRQRDGRAVLWGRAPQAGRVTIEIRAARRWRRLVRLRTAGSGIFYARRRVPRRVRLRARAGSQLSLVQRYH